MPPIVQLSEPSSLAQYLATTRQSMNGDQGSSTTFTELLLITFAVVLSIALPFTSKLKTLNYSIWPTYTYFVITASTIFTFLTFALAIVVVVLGWNRSISMDALTGAAFALPPALLYIPMSALKYTKPIYLVRKRRSLCVTASKMRYVRGGSLCG